MKEPSGARHRALEKKRKQCRTSGELIGKPKVLCEDTNERQAV